MSPIQRYHYFIVIHHAKSSLLRVYLIRLRSVVVILGSTTVRIDYRTFLSLASFLEKRRVKLLERDSQMYQVLLNSDYSLCFVSLAI